ncbi:LOG family protein [Aquaspirillum soli]|nr:TIGR00730 family Rossman fold protein [Aquaspirillum sp.]
MKNLCVFCGSQFGNRPEYEVAARLLGLELAGRGIRLIYGGGRVGLMGVVADAVMAAGGEVVGVIPEFLMQKEIGHVGLTELHVVDSMHSRKAKMAELADGFVALPGGFGTFEEFFEVLTWAQLGMHNKPVGLLDVADFYLPMVAFLRHSAAQGFIRNDHLSLIVHAREPEDLIQRLSGYQAVTVPKWLDRAGA